MQAPGPNPCPAPVTTWLTWCPAQAEYLARMPAGSSSFQQLAGWYQGKGVSVASLRQRAHAPACVTPACHSSTLILRRHCLCVLCTPLPSSHVAPPGLKSIPPAWRASTTAAQTRPCLSFTATPQPLHPHTPACGTWQCRTGLRMQQTLCTCTGEQQGGR